jgi:hypothetical protein
MTDRIRTIVVVLDRDMRDDDIESVVQAIRMTRFVAKVETGPVVDMPNYEARSIVFRAVKKRLWNCLMSMEADKDFDFTKDE